MIMGFGIMKTINYFQIYLTLLIRTNTLILQHRGVIDILLARSKHIIIVLL